eukprot:scaffold299513_cov49-Tisochrysis_lutea.AAC.3
MARRPASTTALPFASEPMRTNSNGGRVRRLLLRPLHGQLPRLMLHLSRSQPPSPRRLRSQAIPLLPASRPKTKHATPPVVDDAPRHLSPPTGARAAANRPPSLSARAGAAAPFGKGVAF